jgi:two-component system response regulator AlgR
MNVLIVDDEPLAQQRIQKILEELPQVNQISLANNGIQAVEFCQLKKPDVVFMDIRMPGMDGLEAARHISQMNNVPAIIFTTAYNEYALDAFKVNAVDYLVKPVREEKLIESLEKACKLNRAQLSAIQPEEQARTNITAKISGNIKLIPVKDIIYFHAEQKYVTVKHLNGETVIEDTLKDLQKEFEQDFVRIHRNALVAKKFITGIQKDNKGHSFVTMKDENNKLEISRRHLSVIKKLINSL